MAQLSGRRVLVTGASGLVALPVAVELAKSNEVYAVARFSDPKQKRLIEAAGARAIAFDLADPDLSPLPKSVDVVINYAVLPPTHKNHYDVNAGATGRLARRYRDCEAFVHGSTGSLYEYQGERPLREDDPYGLHSSAENLRSEQDRGGIPAEAPERGLSDADDDRADLLVLRPARRRRHPAHRPGRARRAGERLSRRAQRPHAALRRRLCREDDRRGRHRQGRRRDHQRWRNGGRHHAGILRNGRRAVGQEADLRREQQGLADLGRHHQDGQAARPEQGLGSRGRAALRRSFARPTREQASRDRRAGRSSQRLSGAPRYSATPRGRSG